jgi:hypothetical protein
MAKADGCSLPVIAVDLGGAKIAAGIVSVGCEILARELGLVLLFLPFSKSQNKEEQGEGS